MQLVFHVEKTQKSGQHTLSVKEDILNTFGLMNHTVSFSTTQLRLCGTKAAIEHKQSVNE